jgi:sugar/nucleoside kinase (ribokinase family)
MAILIVVAGEIYVDQVMLGFPSWPQPGEEAYATSFAREVGGGAPHTAAGLARLGRQVVLVGPIGREDGDWVRQRIRQLGVGSEHLRIHPTEPTGTTIAVSSPHDRTFFTYRGANCDLTAVLRDLPTGDHLHVACPCDGETLRAICSRAKTASVDAGWHPQWLRDPAVSSALSQVAWFLPNEREAAHFTGESEPEGMLRRFEALGIHAAVKLGSRGSALLDDGRFVFSPAFPVEAVDTTGAGDNFNAGFLDSWLRQEPPAEWLRAGNLCGALSTRAMGGMTGFPTREEMNEWLSK